MREGMPPLVKIITFERAMGLSRSAMPPLIWRCGFARVWRFTMLTPSTKTFPFLRSTEITRPVLPLSRPAITFTWSSFFRRILKSILCAFCRGILYHLRRKRNDFHEALIAELAGHGAEDARADR